MNKLIKHKVFISIVKWVPVVITMGILFDNLIKIFGFDNLLDNLIDYLFSASLTTIALLYSASIALEFCNWHKALILYSAYDMFIKFLITDLNIIPLNITNIILLINTIIGITMLFAIYNHNKNLKTKT